MCGWLQIGFGGSMCEIPDPRSACASQPCLSGGTCSLGDSLDNFTCKCLLGYRGKIHLWFNSYYFIRPSSHPSINMSTYLFMQTSIHPTIYPSKHSSIHKANHSSIHKTNHSSIQTFIHS